MGGEEVLLCLYRFGLGQYQVNALVHITGVILRLTNIYE